MLHVLFETPRLQARHLVPDDLASLLAVYGDADAMRWVGDGRPLDEAKCREWLDVTDHNVRRRGYGMSALVERASGEVVGFCGLVHPGGQAEAEIKYALKRVHWGRGLATEAATAMLAYGARAHGLARVIATAAPDNAASHKVLLKAGMRRAQLRSNDDGSRTQVFAWSAVGEPAPDAERAFVHSRLIDAPRERVFRAFSDPAHLARWWGPKGFTSSFHDFDFRPGGRWRFVLHGPDGVDHPNLSVFTRIVAPQLIVFDHLSGHHFEMTITLDEQGELGHTTVVGWRQVFDSAAERQRIAAFVTEANEQNLDRLAAEVRNIA